MKKIFMILLLIILSNKFILSIDTNAIKYMPLAVGNKWVYNCVWIHPVPGWSILTAVITKDTIINNKKYFFILSNDILSGWIRVDSTNGNLYKWSGYNICPKNPYVIFMDSISGNFKDTMYHCEVSLSGARVFMDSAGFLLSNTKYKTKGFRDILDLRTKRNYSYNIGISSCTSGGLWDIYYNLKGCVINGIVYGDTTITGLQNISSEIPNSFKLYQNYPNPFNPTTKIKFAVPLLRGVPVGRGVFVKIIVYNVLGKVIVTLVNEQLKPGTYEVSWDGINYPSGVYFYRLITNEFVETKKMVLMK